MENLIRKYGLVAKTGRYTPDSERRRDVIASLLTDEGEIPSDMTLGQYNDLVVKKYMEMGLSVPAVRDIHIGLERIKMRFVAEWIRHPEKRHDRMMVPKYAISIWERLQEQFPYNGAAPREPQPEIAPPETPSAQTLRQLFELLKADLVQAVRQTVEDALTRAKGGTSTYVPPPAAPTDIVKAADVQRLDLPTSAKLSGWEISYTRKFMKDLATSGLQGPTIAAVKRFAAHGETYSGLGFKKLEVMSGPIRVRIGEARYAFRVNRRWRVFLRKDPSERRYVLTRVGHHDMTE